MPQRRLPRILALAALATLVGAPALAGPACSRATLSVTGVPVTIAYCVDGSPRPTPGAEVLVPVTATYSAPGGSMQTSGQYRFIAGEAVSRIVQNVALDRLGMPGKTLHLTLIYTDGTVRVEGALLTPGAITVK